VAQPPIGQLEPHQVVDVAECPYGRGGMTIAPGECEQVVDQPDGPVDLGDRGVDRLARPLRRPLSELERGARGGQGTAELVGCIGHETPLRVDGVGEALDGTIHAGPQRFELVAGSGDIDPTAQIRCRDGVELGAHPVDGSQ